MVKHVSDTSCLILFKRIECLEVIHSLYKTLIITPEVAREFGIDLPNWIHVVEVKNKAKQAYLGTLVDWGEASIIALALALEIDECVLLIDDKRGRRLAKELGFELTGTLGTLLKAKQKGIIQSIKSHIEQLNKNGYWISEKLVAGILIHAGEHPA